MEARQAGGGQRGAIPGTYRHFTSAQRALLAGSRKLDDAVCTRWVDLCPGLSCQLDNALQAGGLGQSTGHIASRRLPCCVQGGIRLRFPVPRNRMPGARDAKPPSPDSAQRRATRPAPSTPGARRARGTTVLCGARGPRTGSPWTPRAPRTTICRHRGRSPADCAPADRSCSGPVIARAGRRRGAGVAPACDQDGILDPNQISSPPAAIVSVTDLPGRTIEAG